MASNRGALTPTGDTAAGTFSLLTKSPGWIAEVMATNLGGDALRPFDLDRIKVPLGGQTTWSIPTLEGEVDAKEFLGIIVERKAVRSFWSEPFGTGAPNQAPDCHSDDSLVGVGTPGGVCAQCPMSRFGYNGERPRCAQTRLLFIVLPTGTLPVLLSAPPTSLGAIKKYFLRLSSEGLPFYSVVTRFALTKQVSKNGNFPYAQITPSVAARLSAEQAEAMREYSSQLTTVFAHQTLTPEDYNPGPLEGWGDDTQF